MAKRHSMTPARRAALRKAQAASARKRRGKGKGKLAAANRQLGPRSSGKGSFRQGFAAGATLGFVPKLNRRAGIGKGNERRSSKRATMGYLAGAAAMAGAVHYATSPGGQRRIGKTYSGIKNRKANQRKARIRKNWDDYDAHLNRMRYAGGTQGAYRVPSHRVRGGLKALTR